MSKKRSNRKWMLIPACLFILLAALCWFVLPGYRFSGFVFFGLTGLVGLYALLGRWADHSSTGRVVRLLVSACLVVGLISFAVTEQHIISAGRGNPSQKPDAVIVLGAGVNGTEPSLSLYTRLQATKDYLNQNPEVLAVCSGGKGQGERISEADCMVQYLIENGISEERLLPERQAKNTAENFSYSRKVLEEQGLDLDSAVIAVVSNDFHLYRAQLLAEREGLTTIGVPTLLPWRTLSVNYYVREYFAVMQVKLQNCGILPRS